MRFHINYLFLLLTIILLFLINNLSKEHFRSNIKKKSKKNIKYDLKNKDSKLKLDNKVIIITGSTKGIGYKLAKTLNNLNTKLVINGRSQENVDKVVNELKKTNENVIGVAADISKEEDVENLFKTTVDKYEKIDILVNNAATLSGSRDLTRKKYKDWKKEISVNIDGVFLLSQKVINHMRQNRIHGRIINVSSDSVKLTNSSMRSGTHILTKSFIERMSDIMADENYTFKIAVTTIRIDEFIDTGVNNMIPFEIPDKLKNITNKFNMLSSMFASDPSKVMPVFIYVMKAPFHEISGKLISTRSYLENPKLSKIIPTYQLTLDQKLFSKAKLTKSINHRKNKNVKYLVKQNDMGPSKRIKKKIQNIEFGKINTNAKYNSILDRIIAKKLGISKNNICFFRNEYDALKKIIDLFVPNYSDVITIYPSWPYLFLLCNEKKINLKYTTLKDIGNNTLQPNFYFISRFINSRTKMIYLSSPNTTTGMSILNKDFLYLLSVIPNNIPILLDQRYYEFTDKTNKVVKALKYINKNVIILRSFNNYYGIENLELAYTITNKEIAKIIRNSQLINNPLDSYTEKLALNVYNDSKYYKFINNYYFNEKKRLYKLFEKRNIKYYPSETNFLLIQTTKTKEECKKDLEKRKIILYESDDAFGSYWTLPISDKNTNNLVVDIITSYVE